MVLDRLAVRLVREAAESAAAEAARVQLSLCDAGLGFDPSVAARASDLVDLVLRCRLELESP